MMKDSYKVVITSDPDSDDLLGEIWFESLFAEVLEPPPYRVIIYPPPDGGTWEIPFDLLQEVLQAVKSRLDAMQGRRPDGLHDSPDKE